MALKMRKRVRKACSVIPHLARVGDVPVQRVGHPAVHFAVGKRVCAIQHVGRPGAVFRPVGACLWVATVDTACGQHHDRSGEVHFCARGFIHGHGARDLACAVLQCGHAVVMQQRETPGALARGGGCAQCRNHAPREFARCAPDHVVTRHAVAVAVHAALDPAHGGHELHAFAQQPVVDLAARMLHVVLGPLPGQHVVYAQCCKTQPVAQGNVRCVGNLHARLQRRAHQRHTAKSPQRQSPQALRRIAVHQGNRPAGAQAFERRDDTGQPPTDHHHIVRL